MGQRSRDDAHGAMRWTNLDQAYGVAQANGFPFNFHVLVWGNQQPTSEPGALAVAVLVGSASLPAGSSHSPTQASTPAEALARAS